MDNEPQTALGHLNRGIDTFESGNLELARRHFAQSLLLEPENDVAWLWLAEASEDAGEKRYCLERADKINPDNAGHSRLTAIEAAGVKAVVPPVISDLATPKLPPSLRSSSPSKAAGKLRMKLPVKARTAPAGRIRRALGQPITWLALAAAVLLVLAATKLIFSEATGPDREVVYFALVAPMTGDSATVGREVRNAATLAAQEINRTNTGGPEVRLLYFDDKNDPDVAANVARQIVADDRIAGVIGHSTSTTSLAAAPIYADANMPVITGQATIDDLSSYPNQFRTIFSNLDEARILVQYMSSDLNQTRVSIVAGPSAYEQSLAADFEQEFARKGTVVKVWNLTEDREASAASIVDAMKRTDDMGALFFALTEVNGFEVLKQVRNADLDPLIVGSETLGTQAFADRFKYQSQELKDPGFFTHRMYAVSPLLYDSVGGETLSFATTYKDAFGRIPDWRAPKIWDAVNALANAASRVETGDDTVSGSDLRPGIISELGQMHDQATGFQGLSGTVYFTEGGRSPQGLSIGMFDGGQLVSAPVQYRMIDNLTQYDIDAEKAAGNAIELDGYYVRRYRVVYVGVEMIELRDLSTADQSYTADFYIYFRYNGNDDPLNIIFTNATNGGLTLGEPLTSEVTDGGMNYRLYRVQGVFSEPMDFSDYPWDQHQLMIRIQNPVLTQNDIVYVTDPAAMEMTQAERLRSGFDLSRPFNHVPSWIVKDVQFEQASIASTSDDYDTDGITYYSEFRVVMDTTRDVNAFLMKNLLPLALLTLVTYIAIWFPAEQAGARIGFAITALLSSSVMLNAISNQLPAIGYNVAIEWGYYAYIGLSAVLVLLTIAVDRAYKTKRFARVRRLDTFIRIAYPLTIAIIAALYYRVYRDGTRSAGGQEDIRFGVMIVLGILLALSAVVVIWPDHFHWRSFHGDEQPEPRAPLETETV